MFYHSILSVKKFSDEFILKIEKYIDNLRLISPFKKGFSSTKKIALYVIDYVLHI